MNIFNPRTSPTWLPDRSLASTLLLGILLLLAGCVVGPDYSRPDAPIPQHFKEADGWKPAEPKEAASGSAWWSVYDDPVLDDLERQVAISNQTLKASEAAWRQAVALTNQASSGLFPTLMLGAEGARSKSSPKATAANQFSTTASASWDLDIWGKIRRTVESDVASAQASAADLAAARLSTQATLATDYIGLRIIDAQKQLYAETIEAYRRSLQITQNRYQAGVAAKSEVITAQTQLQGAQSQLIGLDVQRSQLEHAIAVLIGRPPADFALAAVALSTEIPVAPAGVPSSLLERRPDIAEAERKMAAANAQIGVAIAGYYPDLSLSGSGGFSSSQVPGLLKASNSLWSIGGEATATLLDFGARSAQVDQARAAYDAAVASYRQTVLTAFQQVEDELAALRILEQQNAMQAQTVAFANEAVRLTLNQYKAGTVDYTAVATAQVTALNDTQTLLNIHQSRLVASVALIQALGGGWSPATLAITTPATAVGP
jgi:NodT family efflux transporter outer membrane factor (OMF) lipoprotein